MGGLRTLVVLAASMVLSSDGPRPGPAVAVQPGGTQAGPAAEEDERVSYGGGP